MYNPQTTAILIKSRADSMGITMQELNKLCGLNKNTISASASSKYGLGASILFDISEALECSVDYLLGRDAPQFSSEHTELMHLFDTLDDDSKEIIARLIVKLAKDR